jgi:uncharacterized membrane protein YdcZ (DUF606 family)
MLLFAILVALAAGAANPFQSGTNAELNKQLSQPLTAGLWVYFTGFCALLLVTLTLAATRQLPVSSIGRNSHVLAACLGGRGSAE